MKNNKRMLEVGGSGISLNCVCVCVDDTVCHAVCSSKIVIVNSKKQSHTHTHTHMNTNTNGVFLSVCGACCVDEQPRAQSTQLHT